MTWQDGSWCTIYMADLLSILNFFVLFFVVIDLFFLIPKIHSTILTKIDACVSGGEKICRRD